MESVIDMLSKELNQKRDIVGHMFFAAGVFEEKASRTKGKEKARYLALMDLMLRMAEPEELNIDLFRGI